MRTVLILSCLASSTATIHADVPPDPADDEIPGFALKGPFASRVEACDAAFETRVGTRGDCKTYRAVATLPANGAWKTIEIGEIADKRPQDPTRHYAIVVSVGKHWFADFLGTNGTVDTEFFPPCQDPKDNCSPFHGAKRSLYDVPKLSLVDAVKGGSKELVLMFSRPADVGFRAYAPKGELVQVCGLSEALIPSCTSRLIAEAASGAAVRSPAQLFSGTDELKVYGDIPLEDGHFHAFVGHLRFVK